MPIRCAIPTLDGPVLVVLARSLRPLSGREVARLVGPAGSQRGVLAALNRLVEHGVVDREEHPPAALFTLNREHLAADAIAQLTDLRARLYERLERLAGAWSIAPAYLGIFGSAVRGDGTTRSDVDVLVVRPSTIDAEDPAWVGQVRDLEDRVTRWTGNPAETVEYAPDELAALAEREDPFVERLVREARRVTGPPLVELLCGATPR